MKYKIIIIVACAACSVSSHGQDRKRGTYTVNGVISDHEGQLLLLSDAGNTEVDSAVVKGGKFRFRGSLPDSMNTKQMMLRFPDFHDYKLFWIEKSNITIKIAGGDLRGAVVHGSKMQSDNDRYTAHVKVYEDRLDSLFSVFMKGGVTPDQKKVLDDARHKLESERKIASGQFIKQNPNSPISAHVLSTYAASWGSAFSSELYESLSSENKVSATGRQIKRYLSLNRNLQIGDRAVDFTQANSAGDPVSLSSFLGKVVLIEFWGAWCMPCRQTNPELVAIYTDLKDKGFEILGVSLDVHRDSWLGAIKSDGLTWINVSELNGTQNTAALIYGISAVPDNFLIDRNGMIVARGLRGKELRERVSDILKH